MRIVKQTRPVVRTVSIAGIKEGVWQSNNCNDCRKLADPTEKLLCLNLGDCGIPP